LPANILKHDLIIAAAGLDCRDDKRNRFPVSTKLMDVTTATVRQILTRTSGYLKSVASHSLQPYRGCALGNSLCGVGCYVQHNHYLTRGAAWGGFLEARTNAPDCYRRQYPRELNWARRACGRFGIFLSSSTEPFQPFEPKFRVTRAVLEAMIEQPPDFLILQTHSHRVTDYLDLYPQLAERTELRFHLSIESDRDRLPGLPPPASSVEQRIHAAGTLKATGLPVVITVSPLLPIADPDRFFQRLAGVADAVVIDHFIYGDGSSDGARTRRTRLPEAMSNIDPESLSLGYRDRIAGIAQRYFPGNVGISIDGFAGRMLGETESGAK
jgi:DNA repair photolyase